MDYEGGYEVPPVSEELLVIDGYCGRESQFSSWMWSPRDHSYAYIYMLIHAYKVVFHIEMNSNCL